MPNTPDAIGKAVAEHLSGTADWLPKRKLTVTDDDGTVYEVTLAVRNRTAANAAFASAGRPRERPSSTPTFEERQRDMAERAAAADRANDEVQRDLIYAGREAMRAERDAAVAANTDPTTIEARAAKAQRAQDQENLRLEREAIANRRGAS